MGSRIIQGNGTCPTKGSFNASTIQWAREVILSSRARARLGPDRDRVLEPTDRLRG